MVGKSKFRIEKENVDKFYDTGFLFKKKHKKYVYKDDGFEISN